MDSGSAAIESLLVLPGLMVLMTAGMQFALYGLASHAAALVAEEAGAVARASGQGPATAKELFAKDVRVIAGGLLIDPRLSVQTSDGTTDLTVSARVPSIFPGIHLAVEQESVGPSQEFRAG